MSWPIIPFEDLYESPSKNGVTRPARVRGTGCKMINMGELFAHDRISNIEMERVQLDERELLSMLVEPGDLLFARQSLVLSGAGKCSIVVNADEPTTFESHLIRVRLKRDVADPLFYHYYFRSPSSGMKAIVTQGVQAGIRGSDLRRLPVRVPPRLEQERVSSILSAYDDLIDNNRRRLALLEEAARLLYREWFVDLRFPGHEHAAAIDGVPKGWKRMPLSECATFQSGGTPSKSKPEFWDGDIPWISSGELTRLRVSSSRLCVTDEAVQSGSRYAEVGTILGVVRGMSLAKEFRLGIVTRRVCFNQDLKAFVPDRGVKALYLFHALDEQRERIRQKAGEASHGTKKLETTVLQNLLITVGAPSVRQHFIEYVQPLHEQMDVLMEQNSRLERARDLLLPRLMSGEIAV